MDIMIGHSRLLPTGNETICQLQTTRSEFDNQRSELLMYNDQLRVQKTDTN